jgi:WD40 repeat protein
LVDTPASLAIDVGGNRAYTGGYYGGLISVFDISRRARLEQFGWHDGITGDPRDDGVNDLALSPDGSLLLVGGNYGISLWDVRQARQTHEQKLRESDILHVEFLPGSMSFIADSITTGPGETISRQQAWSIDGADLRKEVDRRRNGSIALLPDRREMLVTKQKGVRRLRLPTVTSEK